jgi:hypothetical protein
MGVLCRVFALDRFGAKLFQVAGNFQTKSGQALAEERTRTMRDFFVALLNEIGTHRLSGGGGRGSVRKRDAVGRLVGYDIKRRSGTAGDRALTSGLHQ